MTNRLSTRRVVCAILTGAAASFGFSLAIMALARQLADRRIWAALDVFEPVARERLNKLAETMLWRIRAFDQIIERGWSRSDIGETFPYDYSTGRPTCSLRLRLGGAGWLAVTASQDGTITPHHFLVAAPGAQYGTIRVELPDEYRSWDACQPAKLLAYLEAQRQQLVGRRQPDQIRET